MRAKRHADREVAAAVDWLQLKLDDMRAELADTDAALQRSAGDYGGAL